MSQYSYKLLDAILRQDFLSFLSKSFNSVNLGEDFIHNWHLDLMSDYLEAVRLKHIKRLIINIPPRSLKSICVNVAWSSWILGIKPSIKIISASYSAGLSIKHSIDARLIIQSDWYKNIFPNTRISPNQNQKHKFLTTENGFRFATSVGGTLTGEGGDVLIIDDPHNPAQIHSHKIRNQVINWFENSFMTRMNNKKEAVVIIIMQRLHKEDLSGYLLSKGGWELLKIPIFAQQDIHYNILGKHHFFPKNHLLNAQLDDINLLNKLQSEIGIQNYNTQYLQTIINEDYNLIYKNEISFYNKIPNKFSYFVLSLDSAIKMSDNSDYTVCSCWGILDNCYYLVDLVREKMGYPLLKTMAISQITKYNPKYVLIEDKASGQSLIQDLNAEGYLNIYPIKPHLDKFTRFASVIPILLSGKAVLPLNANFTEIVVKEITEFPRANHDDIVDSISQFLLFMKKNTTPKKYKDIKISVL